MKHAYTPLKIGDLLPISPSAAARARANFTKPNLILGHQLEYSHNELFEQAGWNIIQSQKAELFDRTVDGCLQDDKVATWGPDGLSTTHTFSYWQRQRWNREWKEKEQDVVLQCFEYTDPTHTVARYMGPVSWRMVRAFATPSKYEAQELFFNREQAYKWSLIKVD